jgi:glucose-fructose oxidoreductase
MNEIDDPSSTRREFLRRLSLGALAMTGRSYLAARTDDPPRPARRPLGVALVGLGNYSTGQLGPALRETKLCRLAGVVTGSAAKGRRWSREYGFPEASIYHYDTMHRMADNRDIDIVYVVTPNGLHAEHTIRAAQAGKHVISEKPMANTVAECDAMIAACREAKVMLSIGYRLHFDPYHQELMRLARDQDFGAFTKENGAFAFVMSTPQWRAEKKLAGGGPLMDLGIYVLHEACLAANGATPRAVTAHEPPKERPDFFRDVEESIGWTMEFPDGATAEGWTSYNGNGNNFHADAPRGWFDLQNAFSYGGIIGKTSRGRLKFPRVNQQARQMDDFADCILTGRPTPVPGELGRRDLQIITAIYAAARSGKRAAV